MESNKRVHIKSRSNVKILFITNNLTIILSNFKRLKTECAFKTYTEAIF